MKTLVFANVFISIAALAQVLVTYVLFPLPISYYNNSYLLLILLSTFIQYNVQRGYMINQANVHTERSQWLIKHRKTLLYSVALFLVIALFLCNSLSYTSIGIIIGAEVISTLYYLPPVNLRKFGYIKPFIISFIWVISCCVVPLIEHGLVTPHSYLYFTAQFLFIAVLCLLFDIKDMENDYLNGVNTYANKFGVTITKVISFLLLTLATFSFYAFTTDKNKLTAELITVTITAFTILFTNDKKHDFYYYLWVDGLLLLQGIAFVLLCYK